ncbi:alcohol dehydrogenase catalytic domain-containing protein [Streptomyces sp. NPDC096934]|uniref:alcohol dehydrogenase catalytic domain-containing protein n=1 Tax=Streptomyces sp. NPDC096934 TaxID=3155551 RepID=UPI0033326EE1
MYRACEVTDVRRFRLVEREVRYPGFGEVRIRVRTCGVCHSDALAVEGLRKDPSEPIVPGHEFVGVINAVGDGVTTWSVGQRVGVGFLGGHCGVCPWCRRGDFVNCTDQPQTGTTTDGGYAEVAYARASGLVAVPEELSDAEASPLLCAGLTVYNALLKTGARHGSLVAVQGIGGLGHLGVQYAQRLGYRVAAIARGTDKAALAAELGAEHYIDSTAEDPGSALQRLGGAAAVIATASVGSSMSPLMSGLAPRGEMIAVGATPDPLSVSTRDLIFGERTLGGSLTGSSIENEDSLDFAARTGVHPMIETRPLAEASDGYERMMSGKARFRVVLDMSA